MSAFLEAARVNAKAGAKPSYLLRWRGRSEGPYSAIQIDTKLAANEIGLLHEIYHEERWITLRAFIAQGEATVRAERQAREERELRWREQELHRQETGAALADPPVGPSSFGRGVGVRWANWLNSRMTRRVALAATGVILVTLVLWVAVGSRSATKEAGAPTALATNALGQATTNSAPAPSPATGRAGAANGTDPVKQAILSRLESLEADYRQQSQAFLSKKAEQSEHLAAVNEYFMDHKAACAALGVVVNGADILVGGKKRVGSEPGSPANLLELAVAVGGGVWVARNADEAKEVFDNMIQAKAKQEDLGRQVKALEEARDAILQKIQQERAKLE